MVFSLCFNPDICEAMDIANETYTDIYGTYTDTKMNNFARNVTAILSSFMNNLIENLCF